MIEQHSFTRKRGAGFTFFCGLLCCLAGGPHLLAQKATTTSAAQLSTSTVTSAQVIAENSDGDTTRALVLMGEKVSLDSTSPKKGPLPDLIAAANKTLASDVTDFTATGVTLERTAEALKLESKVKPDVTIVFGGYADEQAGVPEDKIKNYVRQIAAALKRRNPDMKIFLVPSATYLGTLASAELRMAAEEAGIAFVPLGTEVSGEPFVQAMLEVESELSEPDTQEGKPVAAPQAPDKAVTIRGRNVEAKIATPKAASPGPQSYEAGQASLQRELNRIAGETEDSGILPADVEKLSTATLLTEPAIGSTTDSQAIPPGGTVVKRGKDAQENINMRPLPALKAYRPQIPVPRVEVDTKEPALSR